MRSPVVISRTATTSEADLLAAHLRAQGIEAVARTHLDRTTYAGLGGATVLVAADQHIEAELELLLMDAARSELDVTAPRCPPTPTRWWVRVCGVVALTAMALGTAVPSVALIWGGLAG